MNLHLSHLPLFFHTQDRARIEVLGLMEAFRHAPKHTPEVGVVQALKATWASKGILQGGSVACA